MSRRGSVKHLCSAYLGECPVDNLSVSGCLKVGWPQGTVRKGCSKELLDLFESGELQKSRDTDVLEGLSMKGGDVAGSWCSLYRNTLHVHDITGAFTLLYTLLETHVTVSGLMATAHQLKVDVLRPHLGNITAGRCRG